MYCTSFQNNSNNNFQENLTDYLVGDISNIKSIKSIHKESIHNKYLPILYKPENLKSRVTLIKSPCGTGKNFTLEPLISEIINNGGRVIIIVPRISLSYTLSEQYKGLPFYQDEKNDVIKGSCCVVLDSVRRIELKSIDLLIIDEAAQQSHHSFGGTLMSKRLVEDVNQYVQELINISKKVIFQDADLDWHTITHCLWWSKYIDCSLKENCRLIENTKAAMNPTVYARSEIGARPTKYPTEKAPLATSAQWDLMCQELTKGLRSYIYCTTKADATLLNSLIKEEFPNLRIALCTADTSNDVKIKECVRKPSLFAKNFDIIIGSPAIQTGISIEEDNTWRVFGWVKSYYDRKDHMPTAMDVYQGMSRVRKPINNRWDILFYNNTINFKAEEELDHLQIYEDIKKVKVSTDKKIKNIEFEEQYKVRLQATWIHGREFHFRYAVLAARNNIYSGHLGHRCKEYDFIRSINTEGSNYTKIECHTKGSFEILCDEKKIPYEVIDDNDYSQDKANEFLNHHYNVSSSIKYEAEMAIVNADHISKEEYDAIKNNPALKCKENNAKVYSYEIREFYNLKDLVITDVKHFMHGGKYQVYNYVQTDEMMKGNKQAVYAIDARQSGKWSGYRNDVGDKAILKREIWLLLGITDFQKDFETGTQLKKFNSLEVAAYFTKEKLAELRRYKFPQINTKNLSYFFKNFIKATGIKIDCIGRDRNYYISDISEILRRSESYRRRIKDPSKVNTFEDLLIEDEEDTMIDPDWSPK